MEFFAYSGYVNIKFYYPTQTWKFLCYLTKLGSRCPDNVVAQNESVLAVGRPWLGCSLYLAPVCEEGFLRCLSYGVVS
jgi:hypothetical protein